MKFNPEITYFAETNFRNKRLAFGIKKDDRRRHMYVIGKTGMGKSEMLKNMAIQDIRNGNGLAVVDPHGELVEDLIKCVPSDRINDVVYFNPADIDWPLAFNILESVDEAHQKNLVASGLIGIFKKLWADSWGPRLEYLLRNAILALLDYPGATLLGVTRILIDKEYRKKVIAKVKDPIVKAFWTQEYTKYSQQFQVEAISPIQNKVGQFLSLSLIRNIIGQVKSTIDLREIMDNKKILLLNLSKGRIGEDASALLGAMMITKIQMAAMGRVTMSENTREDFYLYVDEFQNFVTDSFADILSEARKYRLNLIIAHQYIAQLTTRDSTKVRDAAFGNVGTIVTFRVGADDAEFLAKEFIPTFDETDLVNLTKFDIYLKLMIDGMASTPFSASTFTPFPKDQVQNEEKIINVTRERYASKREVIEDKIARWAVSTEEIEAAGDQLRPGRGSIGASQKFKVAAEDKEVYQSVCSNCGRETKVKFKPDGVRPIFCPDCLKLFKQNKIDLSHLKASNAKKNDKREITKPPVNKKIIVEDVYKETPAEISLSQALGDIVMADSNQAEVSAVEIDEDSNNLALSDEQSSEDELVESSNTIKPGQVVKF